MKKKIFLPLAGLLLFGYANAQALFSTYTDSVKLVEDANTFIQDFSNDVKKVKPEVNISAKAILNTKPYLIFYSEKENVVNLPLWQQVIPDQQAFFTKLAGGDEEGQIVFGNLFNGYYLPHELGHALAQAANKTIAGHYENEYFANTVAVLYWRKTKHFDDLEQSYQYAKKLLSQITSPVPEGQDEKKYFNDHYAEIAKDPYKYGFFQFNQLVKIFEDESLKDFDEFLKTM